MDIPLYQVDAFTSELFRGNPARALYGFCIILRELIAGLLLKLPLFITDPPVMGRVLRHLMWRLRALYRNTKAVVGCQKA